MMIGWLVASLSMGVLLIVSDLSLREEESVNEKGELINEIVAPENAPSIPLLSLTTLLFGTGFWYALLQFFASPSNLVLTGSENAFNKQDG